MADHRVDARVASVFHATERASTSGRAQTLTARSSTRSVVRTHCGALIQKETLAGQSADAQHAYCPKIAGKLREVGNIGSVDDVSTLSCRGHDDRVDRPSRGLLTLARPLWSTRLPRPFTVNRLSVAIRQRWPSQPADQFVHSLEQCRVGSEGVTEKISISLSRSDLASLKKRAKAFTLTSAASRRASARAHRARN